MKIRILSLALEELAAAARHYEGKSAVWEKGFWMSMSPRWGG